MKEEICPSCQETICEHGVCWCDDAEGACVECSDREESEYQCKANAEWYAGWDAIFEEER